MANRQLVSQIGVFALIGLNVGAYYVFWPHKESENRSEARAVAPVKGQAQLLPPKKEKPAIEGVAPLQISKPPADVPQKIDDDPLAKLLQHIQKETGTLDDQGVKPVRAGDVPPRDESSTSNVKQAGQVQVSAAPSPWLLSMEMLGTQTLLIAKLREPALEFRIRCDRVEKESPGGAVKALGKVEFTGAGFTGTCQRLTVPTHEPQLLFEDQVYLLQDAIPGAGLRGERIVWDLPAKAMGSQQPGTPAEFRPSDSVAPLSK